MYGYSLRETPTRKIAKFRHFRYLKFLVMEPKLGLLKPFFLTTTQLTQIQVMFWKKMLSIQVESKWIPWDLGLESCNSTEIQLIHLKIFFILGKSVVIPCNLQPFRPLGLAPGFKCSPEPHPKVEPLAKGPKICPRIRESEGKGDYLPNPKDELSNEKWDPGFLGVYREWNTTQFIYPQLYRDL